MAGEDHYQSDKAEPSSLQKALRENIILRELADLLNSSLDREKILQTLARRTTELCEVTRCAVWLLEDTWNRFRPVTYHISEPLLAEQMQKTTGLIWQRSLLPLDNPIIQRLLADGEMLYIDDLRTEPSVQTFAETFLVHSVLLLALVRDGRPMGVMSLDDPGKTRTFSINVQSLGRTIAQQTTIALDNIRLFQQAQAQQNRAEQLIERARTIYDVAMAVNSNEELPTVLKLATNHLVRILGANNGLAMRLNAEEHILLPVDTNGSELPTTSLCLEKLPTIQHIIETGKPSVITSEQATEEELSWFRQFKLKSLLIVPLMASTFHQSSNWNLPGEAESPGSSERAFTQAGAHCVGLVAIYYTKRRKPTSGEYAFAQDIAAQCALAIEKAHLLEKAHQAAELANERARTLDAVFQAMTEGIGVIAPNGEIMIRNHAAARFLNIPLYSRTSLANILKRYPTYTIDGRPYTFESFPLQEALNGATYVNGERLLSTRNDGVQRVLEITATPLRDANKQPVGLVAAFRDVTSQVEAEQRVRHALDAFLHIAEAVSHSADIREALHSTLAKTLTTLHCQRGMVHLLPPDQQSFSPLLSLGFSPDEEARWLEEQQIWLSPDQGQEYGFYEQILGGQTTLICAANAPVRPHLFENTMVLASPIKHSDQVLGVILLDRSRIITVPHALQPLSR
ncbi:MAG TPA: GAF domain-containing protein, partial [Ktedonobacteraceae bacterium]|nr:GAF domain-containing protein [Ktedonobacteraceae bacterium]